MNNIIEQLSDEIYLIRGKGNGKIPYSNSIIFADFLIDTGISIHHIEKIKNQFKIKDILFSHWHEDHIRDNEIFKNARKSCHVLEKKVLEDTSYFMKYYYVLGTPAQEVFNYYLFNSIKIKDIEIDKTFEDGTTFEIGKDLCLNVIYAPGHSAGHCCFYEKQMKVAFFADIDLSKFGPWYGCLDSNIIDFESSIEKLLKLDVDVVVTGHVGLITGKKVIKDRLKKYKSIIKKREDMILEQFSERKEKTIDDLMQKNIIYNFYKDSFYSYLLVAEKAMLSKHLNKLIGQEKLVKDDKEHYYLQ
ncbi:MAG: MBL fold metallo-hydrolase [Promethearchaeota archaeon]